MEERAVSPSVSAAYMRNDTPAQRRKTWARSSGKQDLQHLRFKPCRTPRVGQGEETTAVTSIWLPYR